MAAPPDRTNVSPAMPMNSASSRRSRWSGLAQSAQPRWPPTEAIRAARPTGSALRCSRLSGGDFMSGLAGGGWHVGRAGMGQVDWDHDPVEQLLADALGQRGLLEAEVVVDGVVGDGRGLVVADDRRQRGDHHHRAIDVLLELRL